MHNKVAILIYDEVTLWYCGQHNLFERHVTCFESMAKLYAEMPKYDGASQASLRKPVAIEIWECTMDDVINYKPICKTCEKWQFDDNDCSTTAIKQSVFFELPKIDVTTVANLKF